MINRSLFALATLVTGSIGGGELQKPRKSSETLLSPSETVSKTPRVLVPGTPRRWRSLSPESLKFRTTP